MAWNDGVWNDGVWNDDGAPTPGPVIIDAVYGPAVGPTWNLYVRDATGARVAVVDDYRLSATVRFNGVDTWLIALPPGSEAEELLRLPGAGIIAMRELNTVFTGPVTSMRRTRSGIVAEAEIAGVSDDIALADRIAYPEAPALSTTGDAYYNVNAVAETAMRSVVNDNLGPAAAPERRSVALQPDLGRGIVVKDQFRLQTVLEALQRLAATDPPLGFRVIQNLGDTGPTFEVFEITDRTATVILSDERGTLGDYVYTVAASGGNVILVAGGGEGVARLFTTRTDPASIVAWRRVEVFRDARDTSDLVIMARRGDELLTSEAEKVTVEVVPISTEGTDFGVHYRLGDRVTTIVSGAAVSAVVSAVEISVGADGETVRPILSSTGRVAKIPFLATQRDLTSRLAQLETR